MNIASLGGVFHRDGRFFAKVETQESGVRYKMEGPLRAVEHEAVQDLDYIRSAAEGEPTWAEGLQSMKLALVIIFKGLTPLRTSGDFYARLAKSGGEFL